ncbi:MAG: copper chaperone [Chitinophagaceae bacterium]
MKRIALLVSLCCCLSAVVMAQMPKKVTAEIKTPTAVCIECKAIIEAAVPKQVDGLIKLNVIFKRGVTQVQWYPDRTNIEEIKTAIANAGFDADDVLANVDYYKKLPICCKKVEDGGGVPKKKKPGTR